MLVYFRRPAFLRGVRYRVDSRGVEVPDDLIGELPKDAQIIDQERKEKGYINWPSPSGKGVPGVQPPENEFEKREPEGPIDQKRGMPPTIVGRAPPLKDDILDEAAMKEKEKAREEREAEAEKDRKIPATPVTIVDEKKAAPVPPARAGIGAAAPAMPPPPAEKPTSKK